MKLQQFQTKVKPPTEKDQHRIPKYKNKQKI